MLPTNLATTINDFHAVLEQGIPTVWDGKNAILSMQKGYSRNWRQMEWIGFYFEFLCASLLTNIAQVPSPNVYGNVVFDCFRDIDWDFKTHAMNTSSHQIIINDCRVPNVGVNSNSLFLRLFEGI